MTRPLILAIEPDAQQASQLASIASSLGVELLLKDSVGRALEAFGDALPDLILTPPFLSFRDDLALTQRLRELGEAADHIQTVTIPMLEASDQPSRGGMLSALRREKTSAVGPAGCSPAVFAEQIAAYLARAAEARHPSPHVEAPPVEAVIEVAPLPEPNTDPVDTRTCDFLLAFEQQAPATIVVVEEEIAIPPQVRDEWHFFDPQQCRFAALVAKLDAICQS